MRELITSTRAVALAALVVTLTFVCARFDARPSPVHVIAITTDEITLDDSVVATWCEHGDESPQLVIDQLADRLRFPRERSPQFVIRALGSTSMRVVNRVAATIAAAGATQVSLQSQ
jgi:hypothetical protein